MPDPDPRLALVTAAIHMTRHPQHPHHCRCHELAAAALDALGSPATASEGATAEIEDGFGGYWTTCGTGCDLHVVRPGKVQCNRKGDACPDRPTEGAEDHSGCHPGWECATCRPTTGVTSSDGDRGLSEEESDWLAQRDRRMRAEVLREAAESAGDHWCDEVVDEVSGWLRERADRIEAGNE